MSQEGTPSAAAEEPGLVFIKPDYDEASTPDDDITYHFSTSRFVAFLVLCIAVWAMILVLIWPGLPEFITFSQKTGFMSPAVIFVSGLIIFLLLAFSLYFTSIHATRGRQIALFWLFLGFSVAIIFWTVELTIYIDDFIRGNQVQDKTGGYLGVTTILFALGIFYMAWQNSYRTGVAMLLVLVWLMVFLYSVWFVG